MLPINFKQAHSKNYTKGRTSNIEWIVIHYTANKGDTAKNNVDYFSNEVNAHTSAHYFVDKDSIWQSVKDTDTAHAVGGASKYHNDCRNANSIHIEMCDALTSVNLQTRQNAIDLTKYLMEKYNVDVSHVVRHYDVTHKICPAPWVKNTTAWENFKKDLEGEEMTQEQFNEMLQVAFDNMNAKSSSAWAVDEGVLNKAKELGISDGTRPQGLAKREEVIAMIVRAMSK